METSYLLRGEKVRDEDASVANLPHGLGMCLSTNFGSPLDMALVTQSLGQTCCRRLSCGLGCRPRSWRGWSLATRVEVRAKEATGWSYMAGRELHALRSERQEHAS